MSRDDEFPRPLPLARLAPPLPVAKPVPIVVFPVDIPVIEPLPKQINPLLDVILTLHAAAVWCFGAICIVISLAVVAAIPVVQFLTLGYFLEAGGRAARSGRLGDSFVGFRKAAHLGGMILGCWLWILPARLVSDFAHSASIIDPGGRIARQWQFGLYILLAFTGIHLAFALAVGGKLRYFFWPGNIVWFIQGLLKGGYYVRAREAVWRFAMSLRLPYYFWLGVRGFLVGFAWLAIPVSLLALGHWNVGIAPLIGFAGGVLLVLVLPYVPFLQMNMARENRLRTGFDWLAIRRIYGGAPFMHALAFFLTLLFSLPLYLLKIETVPSEAEWLPSLVFVAFILPVKMLTGWAVGLGARRKEYRHIVLRWLWRPTFWPAATAYVVIVFFTQYTSWNGVWSLYEQHAFLLPVPFMGK